MNLKYSVSITFLCAFFISFAQETIVINNVRLFNGEAVQENASVLIENGMIKTISSKSMSKPNATLIEGTGKTLMPALTNAHVHAWAPAALNEAAKAGVLNLLDMHGVEMMMPMMKQYKDSTNYANFYAAGSAATAPEGHGTQFGFPAPTLTKPEEAKQFVADRVKAGADHIKIIVEPWKKTLDHATVKALIDEAHNENKVAVVHISHVEDAVKVLNNNADGLVHIWWDSLIPEAQLKQVSKEKTFFVIPTLLTSILATKSIKERTPEAIFLSERELKSEVKRLYDAGATILAGTDPPNVQINYGTDLYKELKLISEAGIPNIDVLKSATSATAKAFGLRDKGTIEEGALANMLLVNGNPVETISDIENIETIWKNGKLVKR